MAVAPLGSAASRCSFFVGIFLAIHSRPFLKSISPTASMHDADVGRAHAAASGFVRGVGEEQAGGDHGRTKHCHVRETMSPHFVSTRFFLSKFSLCLKPQKSR